VVTSLATGASVAVPCDDTVDEHSRN
jgi:hypothetical protein